MGDANCLKLQKARLVFVADSGVVGCPPPFARGPPARWLLPYLTEELS